MSDDIKLCGALLPSSVFSRYAYGDPGYARYIGEDDDCVSQDRAITIYLTCAREAGHPGKHLAHHTYGWVSEP